VKTIRVSEVRDVDVFGISVQCVLERQAIRAEEKGKRAKRAKRAQRAGNSAKRNR
jgi:hypothetical protein